MGGPWTFMAILLISVTSSMSSVPSSSSYYTPLLQQRQPWLMQFTASRSTLSGLNDTSRVEFEKIRRNCLFPDDDICRNGPFCFSFSNNTKFQSPQHKNHIVNDECHDLDKFEKKIYCKGFATIKRVEKALYQIYLVGKLDRPQNSSDKRQGWIGFTLAKQKFVMEKNSLAIICSNGPNGTGVYVTSLIKGNATFDINNQTKKKSTEQAILEPIRKDKLGSVIIEDRFIICSFRMNMYPRSSYHSFRLHAVARFDIKAEELYFGLAGNTKHGFTAPVPKYNESLLKQHVPLHHDKKNGGYYGSSTRPLDYFNLLRLRPKPKHYWVRPKSAGFPSIVSLSSIQLLVIVISLMYFS